MWTAVPPDLPFVQRLATALGVGGTATPTADGFVVAGGIANLRIAPVNGSPGWRLEMDPCPIGRCRPPDVTPTRARPGG